MTTMLTRLDPADLRTYHATGQWTDETIYAAVAAAATAEPDKVAIRERWRTISYAQLLDAGDRLVAELEGMGARSGDRVAVWMSSRAEVAVALLACSRAGFVCTPSLHREHTPAQVAELLERIDARALIWQPGHGSVDRSAADARFVGIPTRIIETPTIDGIVEGPIFPDVRGRPASSQRTEADTVVYLAFTSGSTGQPKGVMHSDNTLLAPVRALRRDWHIDRSSVVYTCSPLSHNLGFGAMILAMTAGAELVVHDLPRDARLADRLAATKATFVFGVPTHAVDLLNELAAKPQLLPELTGFRISGAPVPPTVAEGLMRHGVVPQSGYGMTEAGSHHYTLPDDDAETICTTSGRPYSGYEVRIFSQDDPETEMPIAAAGQIGARGPSLMLGYFDDQRTTERSFNREAWFMTGDLGVVDDRGLLQVTGRKKDLIIRGGHNINPAEIEDFAMRNPAVARAIAVAVPDDRLGELVCLAVVLRDGWSLDADKLLEGLAVAGLSRFDMPERLVVLVELPLLPSGKVAKTNVRERIASGELVPVRVRYRAPTEVTAR